MARGVCVNRMRWLPDNDKGDGGDETEAARETKKRTKKKVVMVERGNDGREEE